MRGNGTRKTKHLECIDSKRNVWKVRWDFTETENGFSFEEKPFNRKPSIEQIKDLVYDWYNKQTDEKILSGFVWKGMKVWLSSENQFNYKAAFDVAMQTAGQSLPVKFKFGTSSEPVYYIFNNLAELTDFYTSAMSYINTTLDEGWSKKDSINWNKYQV